MGKPKHLLQQNRVFYEYSTFAPFPPLKDTSRLKKNLKTQPKNPSARHLRPHTTDTFNFLGRDNSPSFAQGTITHKTHSKINAVAVTTAAFILSIRQKKLNSQTSAIHHV